MPANDDTAIDTGRKTLEEIELAAAETALEEDGTQNEEDQAAETDLLPPE